jgi:3-dehydro-L-gulonate 2-dehydrogenase
MGKNILIQADKMISVFIEALKKAGFTDQKAEQIAEIFTTNSLEGVYTHGVNRFARFVRNVRDGYIIPDAEPSLTHASGSLEQWNGNMGPGPLNAVFATNRAIELADKNGIGLVTLAHTNHWMRGGLYGWQAARKGYVFIGWTNTVANMPAWGAKDPHLGNNPFVIAVPFEKEAIVLDFAMTVYSYGKMEAYANDGKKLPYPGGYDNNGMMTDDPKKILESWRTLPIGYWKGASLSLLLDILAAILSGGSSVNEITARKVEYSVSQIFIAINIGMLHNSPGIDSVVRKVIDDLHASIPENKETKLRYPGENVAKIKLESLKNGIPVSKNIWEEILSLNSEL